MTKELFVSSTPHETKVGMVEDDLLAEIYLERENEYTLAGSIYKGRVTRVLPGMQSAFVDIGLERDAFLYVSDFMELEDSRIWTTCPTNRPAPRTDRRRSLQPQARTAEGVPSSRESTTHETGEIGARNTSEHREHAAPVERDNRDGMRGRRRRRGRRGERFPESKICPSRERPGEAPRARPTSARREPNRQSRPERRNAATGRALR